jgi:DDE superfamily endonuclease
MMPSDALHLLLLLRWPRPSPRLVPPSCLACYHPRRCLSGIAHTHASASPMPTRLASGCLLSCDDEYIADTEAHPPQIWIFACFCAAGPGKLFIQDRAFDGPSLVAALRDALMPTARRYFDVAHAQRWWLLHDNLPVYRKGLVVRRWVFGQGIQELTIPPRSPDLDPIENLFAHMRMAVDKHFPTTVAALEAAWRAEWDKLPHTLHSALALSMRERCAEVIARDGGATHY